MNSLTIKVGGEGGDGILSIGEILSIFGAKSNMEVLISKKFPAEIKGGYAVTTISFSKSKNFLYIKEDFDILLILSPECLSRNASYLSKASVIIYDSNLLINNLKEHKDILFNTKAMKYDVSFDIISRSKLKFKQNKNILVISFLTHILNLPKNIIQECIVLKFKQKKILNDILSDFLTSYDISKELFPRSKINLNKYKCLNNKSKNILLNGNEGIALGLLAAQCKYISMYPITPATSIANYLVNTLPSIDGIVYQSEDEIAAIGNCIGVSFGGNKAATLTSGPGLSLMTELISLAIITEIPLVIINVQRGGPSTGMPTKSLQSDLLFSCFSGHGDGPRIVLSISNIEDCFKLPIYAFNLSEKYQTPVILLSEANLSNQSQTTPKPNLCEIELIKRKKHKTTSISEKFKRYKFTNDNISPISTPGTPDQMYTATGLEHTEDNQPNYSMSNHIKMTKKRWNKFNNLEQETSYINNDFIYNMNAKVAIIAWGTKAQVCKQILYTLNQKGNIITGIFPKLLFPIPIEFIDSKISKTKKVIIIEDNYQGHFTLLVKSKSKYSNKISCITLYNDEHLVQYDYIYNYILNIVTNLNKKYE